MPMRLSIPTREQLDPAGQEIWDKISAPRNGIHGPFLMLMYVPQLADRIAELGGFLRFHGSLPGTVRELAILVAARTMNVPFEFCMHRPVAEREGVSEATIESVRASRIGDLTGPEKLIANIAASISRDKQLSDELFAAGVKEFGEAQMVELITLVGFYQSIAVVINCFNIELPDGAPDPFSH